MEDELQDQSNNRPWLYKKGQSGNPKGRPKGISMKEHAKLKFASMTPKEREDFFDGLNKIDLWKMAEGNPDNKSDLTSGGKPIIFIDPILAEKNGITPSPETNSDR